MKFSNEKFVTIREASEMTGMSESWFKRLRNTEDSPPIYRFGDRCIRYRLSELLSWIEEHSDGGKQ